MAFWQPIGAAVWHVESELGSRSRARGCTSWASGLVLYSTFLIDHFDLFGLRQVVLYFRKQGVQRTSSFVTPSLYRFVRHPLYIGWIVMFWAAPTHERRALPVRARHDGVHPGGDPAGGARPRRARSASRTALAREHAGVRARASRGQPPSGVGAATTR